jgi:ATP synthase protein I
MVRPALRAGKTAGFPSDRADADDMSDGTRGGENRNVEPADEAALSARLRHLGDRLDQQAVGRATGNVERGTRNTSDPSGMARGLRLSAELVGGVIVGAGVGFGIDRLFGTTPWGFIVLVMLGFAGGVLTAMRSAGVIPERKL